MAAWSLDPRAVSEGGNRISRQTVPGRRGGPATLAATRFTATIVGGPELVAKLRAMQLKVARVTAREAVKAGGEVIRSEWQSRVPVLDAHYRESITVTATSRTERFTSTEGDIRVIKGASGSVGVRHVPGVPDDEQPYLYASRLEFGQSGYRRILFGAARASVGGAFSAQPSARPAFDASADRAVDAMADHLRRAVG